MAIHELKEQIARLPEQPGVYLYFNADGDTIYVGKARALRDRVRNLLSAHQEAGSFLEPGAGLAAGTRPPRNEGCVPRSAGGNCRLSRAPAVSFAPRF